MKLLELTLPTPAANLALDEALLDAAEAGELAGEVLRFWESPQLAVVVGRSSRVAEEVDLAACREANVPVLRRASGGAAVVIGPGCLMYGVVLDYRGREHLRQIDQAHRHVLGSLQTALCPLVPQLAQLGTSDLAIDGRKCSGNSLRCKRDHLLYHGTLLYGFDLSQIGRLLRAPPRQPAYRAGRDHGDFVTNVPLSAMCLRQAIAQAVAAGATLTEWPQERTQRLAALHSSASWVFSR